MTTNYLRRLILLITVLLMFAAAASIKVRGAESGSYTNLSGRAVRSDELNKRITDLIGRFQIPGISAAVVLDGKVVYSSAFGKRFLDPANALNPKEPGNPGVTDDTIFEAASLSKPVFAYAVLRLVQQRKLDLDKPLYQYFEYKDIESDPRYKLITARMVLSHRTGFPNWRRKKPLSILFEPGSKFGYSGEGYMYLQKVVEKIEGRPLEDVITEFVFEPLGMKDSTYVWNECMAKTSATGYSRKGEGKKKWKPDTAWSAGSLHTTAKDYAKFLIAIMDSKNLSSALTRKLFWKTTKIGGHSGNIGWTLGIGFQKTKRGRSFWHWGSNNGFKSFVVGYPEKKFAMVYLTNSDAGLDMADKLVCFAVGGNQPALTWLSQEYKYKISGDCGEL